MSLIWKGDFASIPGKVVLANPMVCTNTAKGDNKLYSDAKGVVPSLDLRFASQKNLNDYMTGQNLITFSRPVGANQSPGTYVDENGIIQLSTADTPRFDHDPTTGESLGLLIEESRTNLIAFSATFGGWSVSSSGDGSNPTSQTVSISAPDNTTQTRELTFNRTTASTSNTSLFSKGQQLSGASVPTGSIYVKAARQSDIGKIINVYLSQTFVPVADLQEVTLTDSWQRVSSVGQNTFTTSLVVGLYSGTASTGEVKVLLWGAQLEEGAFPTSYIPTTGTALTRSADVASITGSNFSSWYNQSEGSIYAESNAYNLSSLSALFSANDGSFSNRITSTPLTYGLFIATNNAIQVSINAGGAWNSGQVVKAGFGIAVNNFSIVLDGSTFNTDNSGSIPVVDRLNIGRNAGSTSPWNGTISRLTYFPERLPDATLQAITA